MMEGLPLLAIMDECDIVRDTQAGAGRALRNGDSAALAQTIRQLRDEPATVAAMGRACRRIYLEKYTPEKSLTKYTALFRALLGDPN